MTPTSLPQVSAAFRATRRTFLKNHLSWVAERLEAVTVSPELRPPPAVQYGIDYVEVEKRQDVWNVRVYFVTGDFALDDAEALPFPPVPPGITPAHVLIRQVGVEDTPVPVTHVAYPTRNDSNVLTVTVGELSEVGTYILALHNVPNVDRFLSWATFSIQSYLLSDPQPLQQGPPPLRPVTPIDYMAKDYASFRSLMLDYFTLLVPDWKERHAADLGIALVEVMAYAADYLSYYQDAVATETYLETARRRISIRRHARLLDYPIHDGCNARVWIYFHVESDILLRRGTPVLTQTQGPAVRLSVDAYHDLVSLDRLRACVFETLYEVQLFEQHNSMAFYTWGASEFSLEKGATRAALKCHYPHLQAGDVLIFATRLGPETGTPGEAESISYHPVRLIQTPECGYDPLFSEKITEITWADEDALPFPMPVALRTPEGAYLQQVSFVYGNIVMADAGRTIAGEHLHPPVPEQGHYLPRLQERHITYRVPYDHVVVRTQAAKNALSQTPSDATPAIVLCDQSATPHTTWTAERELLGCSRFSRSFVVETESDGSIFVRFGDGMFGKQPLPGSVFTATYRVGNGPVDNVGPETIVHVVTNDVRITGVRNFLPAQGGTAPEPLDQVRMNAPQAFRTQERCITEEDYAKVAERHHDVKAAVARIRWTGSWRSAFVYVDRAGGQVVDEAFQRTIQTYLQPFRPLGSGLSVAAPHYVPLQIELAVWKQEGYLSSQLRRSLLDAFSNVILPDGRRGFFYPDNFTFGQPVYLSHVIATAMQISGVTRVDPVRFHRWGYPPRGEITAGRIEMGPVEIARLDNDALVPAHGTMTFQIKEDL
jgi:hypothetical protein